MSDKKRDQEIGDLSGQIEVLSEQMIHAVRTGNTTRIGDLLEKNPALANKLANIVATDVYGSPGLTPLHMCARIGDAKVAAILIAAKADLEARTKILTKEGVPLFSATPMHIAAEEGNPEIVKLLLEAGAKIKSRAYYPDPENVKWYPQRRIIVEAERNALGLAVERWYKDKNNVKSAQSLYLMLCHIMGHRKKRVAVLGGAHPRVGANSTWAKVVKQSTILDYQIYRVMFRLGIHEKLPELSKISYIQRGKLDQLFENLSCAQAYGRVSGLREKLGEVPGSKEKRLVSFPWFTFRHAEAAARGVAYDQYKELTEAQACGLAYDLTREQVTPKSWVFADGHATAARAGKPYKDYEGLTSDQALGVAYDLIREQVTLKSWLFGDGHAAAAKAGISYEKYEDLTNDQAWGVASGLPREYVNHEWFGKREAQLAKAGDSYLDICPGAMAAELLGKYELRHPDEVRARMREDSSLLPSAATFAPFFREFVKQHPAGPSSAEPYFGIDPTAMAAELVEQNEFPAEVKRRNPTPVPSVVSPSFPGFAQHVTVPSAAMGSMPPEAAQSDDEEENTQEDQENPGPATPSSFS